MKHFKEDVLLVCPQPNMSKHDDKPCPYCGRRMDITHPSLKPTRDHIRAKKRFKSENDNRTIVVCMDCNSRKGAKTLEEYLASLYLEQIQARLNADRIAHLEYLLRMGLR